MNIGQRIKELRNQKGWSQKELTAKLAKFGKIGRSTISSWEINANGPKPTNRKNLCEVFEITEAEFFGGKPIIESYGPDVSEALKDPTARRMLIITYKNKEGIKTSLEIFSNLSAEKRQAILALCK